MRANDFFIPHLNPPDVVFVNSLISVCYASSLLEGSRLTKSLGESNSFTPERDIEPTRHCVITFKMMVRVVTCRGLVNESNLIKILLVEITGIF